MPALHATQAVRTRKVPGAHVKQKLPDPSATVPALQFRQVVELPSRKYWPNPQHRAVPVGEQWSVCVALHDAEQGTPMLPFLKKSTLPEYNVCTSLIPMTNLYILRSSKTVASGAGVNGSAFKRPTVFEPGVPKLGTILVLTEAPEYPVL